MVQPKHMMNTDDSLGNPALMNKKQLLLKKYKHFIAFKVNTLDSLAQIVEAVHLALQILIAKKIAMNFTNIIYLWKRVIATLEKLFYRSIR